MEAPNPEAPYQILSSASFAEVPTHVLKHGDTFAVFDGHGDVTPAGNREQGLYHRGTRHLSLYVLHLEGHAPTLLNASVRQDNSVLRVDLTNPDFALDGCTIPHGTLHLARAVFVYDGVLYKRLSVRSFHGAPLDLTLTLHLAADFADIFEVRGTVRARRGEALAPEVEADRLVLGYRGLDGVVRRTRLTFAPAPNALTGTEARFRVHLPPHRAVDLEVAVACEEVDAATGRRKAPSANGHGGTASGAFEAARARVAEQVARRLAEACHVTTSNDQFNAWLGRSLADLNMLLTRVPEGYYPYAGIPWFSTVFGRDGLLTALMALWVNPEVARGVLGFLAATQADAEDPARDAEPGKILHELRHGEMAALGEIPFGQYYGSVDATPLFVLLAGAYYAHTGDLAFVERLWPHLERALAWIDDYGDADGDGFVEYARNAADGLVQQGWKDSDDSVFHDDGRLAPGPIALCEVQGYVFAAKRHAAALARALGHRDRARRLEDDAERLRAAFLDAFWCEDLGTFALALDGEKRPCRVRSSNAGQVLLSGLADEARARRVAETLFAPDGFSGWGLRTLSARERRYNPMSYHNGSVWPHDNALVGAGLGRYGLREEVLTLLRAFFDASRYDPLQRLPELFCGFTRQDGSAPTRYPVACSPQAWATTVPFQLLQAALGLEVRGAERRVRFLRPRLPDFLDRVSIANLQVGKDRLDLVCQRYARNVGVEVTRNEAEVEVEIVV